MKKVILVGACLFASMSYAKPNRVTVNCDGTVLTLPLYQEVKIGNHPYQLVMGYEPGIYLLMDFDGSYQTCTGPLRIK